MDDIKKLEYKINLEVNKYKYFPEDIIEGSINIQPNDNLNNKFISSDIQINFCLTEEISYYCEKYDYTYETISHYKEKKIYIIEEIIQNFDFLKGYSITYGLTVPFKFKIPKIEKSNKLLPTFNFIETDFQCYVRHKLIIEIKNKSNKCSVDIFIKKPKLENGNNYVKIFKDETIKKYFLFNKGRLCYYIETFNYCNYTSPLPIEFHLDKSELKNIKINSIELIINKIISIKEINFLYTKKVAMKKIEIPDNLNNYQIIDNIILNKNEFPEISKNQLENKIYGDNDIDNDLIEKYKKFNYSPPLENLLFNCIYKLQIIIIFEESLIPDKIIEIPIDYYDDEYNNYNAKEKLEENKKILEKEKRNSVNNTGDVNKSDIKDEFVILDKKDFIDLIDGKK